MSRAWWRGPWESQAVVDRHLPYAPAELCRAVHRAASWRMARDWRYWALAMPTMAAIVFGDDFLEGVFGVPLPNGWAMTAVKFAAGAALVGSLYALQRAHFRARLQEEAIERGLRPIRCIRCDYDLSHLHRATCPECGTPIPGYVAKPEAEADA